MNTKFYKTTIDLCCFLPVFFLIFKSCFKKDKKCTDTLIRHKQIFCTNHISSDCLKKIAIRILTIKSVRGYLFLEIFYKRPILENSCCSRIGRATRPLLPRPARCTTPVTALTELAPLLAPLDAALLETGLGCYSKNSTCAMCPEQLETAWGGFGISPCWLGNKKKKKSYTKNKPTPGMQLAPLIEDPRCQPSKGSALPTRVAACSHRKGLGTPETRAAAPGRAAGVC